MAGEFLPVARIEVSQKSGGKLLTIDLPAQRYCQGYGSFLKVAGKIGAMLVHVDSDADYSQVRRILLCAHLHEYPGYLLPIKLDIIRQFDKRREAELAADHRGDPFDRPYSELA